MFLEIVAFSWLFLGFFDIYEIKHCEIVTLLEALPCSFLRVVIEQLNHPSLDPIQVHEDLSFVHKIHPNMDHGYHGSVLNQCIPVLQSYCCLEVQIRNMLYNTTIL